MPELAIALAIWYNKRKITYISFIRKNSIANGIKEIALRVLESEWQV